MVKRVKGDINALAPYPEEAIKGKCLLVLLENPLGWEVSMKSVIEWFTNLTDFPIAPDTLMEGIQEAMGKIQQFGTQLNSPQMLPIYQSAKRAVADFESEF
ncbi:MAG: hypothetical protein LBM93_03275 [Oscillospiraceae bacterium]|jgi:hypothetical protein|nr:hypothetical protein [Oscillospiraceae bacterium]